MPILESSEMYVETIYTLSLEKEMVRGRDICNYLGFSRPSVSRALNVLKEKGYIRKEKNGSVKLTEGGKILAKHLSDRRELLTRHFTSLGVDEKTAGEDAGRIVRFLSDATFEAIKRQMIKSGTV